MKKHVSLLFFTVAVILVVCLTVFLFKVSPPRDVNEDILDKYSGHDHIDYTRSEDGTWQCNGVKYEYYLELDGKWPGTDKNGSAVILSNTKEVDFNDIMDYLFSSQQDAHDSSDWILIQLDADD